MNVIFHTATAIGVATLLTDTARVKSVTLKNNLHIGLAALLIGIISHGLLDYIPHCYPLNSKFDAIISLTIILTLIILTNKNYRLVTGLSFLGCILPDLVDLSPQIINKYLGLNLPISLKIFPWHWEKFSGSIYNYDCNISWLNHTLLIFSIATICWVRRTDIKKIFGRK